MDYSTINLEVLRKLPLAKLAPTYRLQDSPGNGCAGDPPGYPTYYTQSVYTQYGNSPRKGAQLVIKDPERAEYRVVEHSDDDHAKVQARLRRLYVPLPLDHPRVQAWIADKYRHFSHCYRDTERTEYGKPGTLIFPVPSYKLKPAVQQKYDPRTNAPVYSDEYLLAENGAAQVFNTTERIRAEAIATPENHLAVIYIREHYPTHEPRLDWIADASLIPRVGMWWETEATQPSESNCARSQRWEHKHPMNTTWCQWCGRDYSAAAAS